MKKNSETISTLPFRVMTVSLATIIFDVSVVVVLLLFSIVFQAMLFYLARRCSELCSVGVVV